MQMAHGGGQPRFLGKSLCSPNATRNFSTGQALPDIQQDLTMPSPSTGAGSLHLARRSLCTADAIPDTFSKAAASTRWRNHAAGRAGSGGCRRPIGLGRGNATAHSREPQHRSWGRKPRAPAPGAPAPASERHVVRGAPERLPAPSLPVTGINSLKWKQTTDSPAGGLSCK